MTPERDRTGPSTILIVDDDPDIRDALQMALDLALADRAHEILTASDGAEALEAMRVTTPKLILLDLMMPVMSGSELLDVMRRDPRLRDVPVVVVSAWSREAAVAGAQGFLSKPINMDDLLHVIENYC
jgi:CheY-like chemotaxis protein